MRVSLILPTYNEASNLKDVMASVHEGMKPDEVIVVDDDSPDRTWETAEALKERYPAIRVIRRIGKKGLSSAVTDGFAAATGDCLMVMDSDLQHDPAQLPLLAHAIEGGADVAIATRYMEGGGTGEWNVFRKFLSRTATGLVYALLPVRVRDPMSGFFAIRKSAYDRVASRLRPSGFKILFEILSFLPRATRVAEVPFQFRLRKRGKSKLTPTVQIQFIAQVLRIAARRLQYVLYALAAALALAVLLLKVWNLRLLYADATRRSYVYQGMTSLSDARGWPLSDLQIVSVSEDRFRFLNRAHGKGADDVDCYEFPFESDAILPCPD